MSHVPDVLPAVEGGPLSCPLCPASYTHQRSLKEHMKKHRGQTRCPVCHQEFSMMNCVRRHLVNTHGMSRAQVDSVTNRRSTAVNYLTR